MSVPVGKVQIIKMYPITFKEFLLAADERVYNYIEELNSLEPLPEIILNKLELEYKRYLICGGMPEAVTALLAFKVYACDCGLLRRLAKLSPEIILAGSSG